MELRDGKRRQIGKEGSKLRTDAEFANNGPLPTAHFSLLTAHCSLLTAPHSLPTAHCSLLTRGCLLLAIIALQALVSCSSPDAEAAAEDRKSNRLVHEKSPYLLQHAFNPMDWYPWGLKA